MSFTRAGRNGTEGGTPKKELLFPPGLGGSTGTGEVGEVEGITEAPEGEESREVEEGEGESIERNGLLGRRLLGTEKTK